MKYRKLAKTDINVSIIAFGCWPIVGGFTWGHQDKKDSIAALRAAYDHGVNFFDTAEAYGKGRSEQLIAEALSDVRDEIVIASKVSPKNFQEDKLKKSCERSLKNLNTDRIDLYQLHWPNWDVPIEEPLRALQQLKYEGKIRHYGVSNFGKQDLTEAIATDYSICSNQMAYSLLFRAIEFEILPFCIENGISVLCYSPLMQGMLTGKFSTPDNVPADRARTRHFSENRPNARHGEKGAEEETFQVIAELEQLASESGYEMTDLALGWLFAQSGITSVIAGARNAEQAKKNAKDGDIVLSSHIISRLSQITDTLKQKLGKNPDMWHGDPRIR